MAIHHSGAYLDYDPIAKQLEVEGLTASVDLGQHHRASSLYTQVLGHVPADGTAGEKAQLGSILRNRAFTNVREAMMAETDLRCEALLDLADTALRAALSETEPMATSPDRHWFMLRQPGTDTMKARREFLSEHAATLGLLGRAASAREVVLGTQTDARGYFESAHEFARQGSNGYFRVSNAMNAATHERGTKQVTTAAVWIARAVFGVGWTIARDPRNIKSAGGTFVKRISDTVSYSRARSAVRRHP